METVSQPETSVRFENFELDLRTRELHQNGVRLKIRGHPVDVLAILLEHPGELVTRDALQKRLWPDDTFVDFEQILNNSVVKLRDALGDRAESPKFIETLPRLGYRFIAPIESREASQKENKQQETIKPLTGLPAEQFAKNPISRNWTVWFAAAILLALVVVGLLYLRTPLPPLRVTHFEQLTLDGREKIVHGTDGARIYLVLMEPQRRIAQVAAAGGTVTEIPIALPLQYQWGQELLDLSADGAKMLVIVRNGLNDGGFLTWIVGTSGFPVQFFANASNGAWSPDSKRVVYVSKAGDILTAKIDGSETQVLFKADPAHQLTEVHDIAWSPNGKIIRFARRDGTLWELAVNVGNLHELLPAWAPGIRKCCGHWTPDGQFFVFLKGPGLSKGPLFEPLSEIWAIDERQRSFGRITAEPFLLASGPLLWGNPVPSRDGSKIFARGVSLRGELQRYDQQSKRLEPFLNGISAEMLDFSRDGRFVAYVTFPEGILWRANRDGTGAVQLTKSPSYPRNPRWSPDGSKILFTDNSQIGIDRVWIVSSQGGEPQLMFPGDNEPQSLADWSSDGKRIVYTNYPRTSFVFQDLAKVETRIFELSTGKLTILPRSPTGFKFPLWSPDGNFLAGQSFDTEQLILFDFRNQKWKTLGRRGLLGYHNWSHDGRFIYFVRWDPEHVGIYRISLQGGEEELIFDIPKSLGHTGWYSRWIGFDPTDTPLLFRNAGSDEVYALTLGRN